MVERLKVSAWKEEFSSTNASRISRAYIDMASQQSNAQQEERGRGTDFGHSAKVEEADAEVLAIHW
jgi:hypothetical protein